ncbi:MAG: adenosylcobinamide-GDP ribazoletransferase [Peptococcaceae bacterium]|nr:adenosylcobinamide-GDP ribazoletransferase [Peptococcaceae bacterium]
MFALIHLTRLPLPAVKFNEVYCGRATAFFPAAGLILGLILAALVWAAGWLVPAPVEASLLVVGMVVLTGGIHLDGFMDSIDGLFSGRPRERKLEIMRDSRVGAFGVIGVVCLLLLKYSLFLGMPHQFLWKVLLVVPAVSRWCMCCAVIAFPYVRREGLGRIYKLHSGMKQLLMATVITAAVAGFALGLYGIWLTALGGVVTYLAGCRITKELGGLTGDIYGFINELLEVILLFTVYPWLEIQKLL